MRWAAAGQEAAWGRTALLALALLAMCIRALLPAGYMLAPDQAGGRLEIVLCGAHGAPVLFDISTGQFVDASEAPQEGEPRAEQGHCLFANAAALAPVPADGALDVPYVAVIAVGAAFALLRPGRGLAAPPPWPTGPPSHL